MPSSVPPVPPRAVDTVVFSATGTAIAETRRALGDRLADLGLPPTLVDDTVLIANELTSNVVRHADNPSFTVSVRLGATRITVMCEDGSWERLPRMKDADAAATSGRGLRIVDAVAERWRVEVDQARRCKRVQVELPAFRTVEGGARADAVAVPAGEPW